MAVAARRTLCAQLQAHVKVMASLVRSENYVYLNWRVLCMSVLTVQLR